MISLVDSSTSALLGLALDATTMRHQAIAHNIANANTPGYKTISVNFEQSLLDAREAMKSGQGASLSGASGFRPAFEIVQESSINDGAVSLDVEIAKLSENTLHQQALLKALNRHLSMLSFAINEGKR